MLRPALEPHKMLEPKWGQKKIEKRMKTGNPKGADVRMNESLRQSHEAAKTYNKAEGRCEMANDSPGNGNGLIYTKWAELKHHSWAA